jgi:cysteine desulfurase family protein
LVADARRHVAKLIGAKRPQQISFALNGTDALNTAIHGWLRAGDHVVTSVAEHNSVLRPLRWLAEERGVRVSYVGCDSEGVVDVRDIASVIEPKSRLIAMTHASNVTGALQPIEDVAELARNRDIALLVDAAQSLGHVALNVDELGIDLLAAPGHKGLLGPLGTGILYTSDRVAGQLESRRQGGTGTNSEVDRQPDELPHKYEAGNLNVPGIIGLGAGAKWVTERRLEVLRRHELELSTALWQQLAQIDGVTLYGPADSQKRVSVVSFSVLGFEPQEVAALLDVGFGVEVRSGLHCAPRMHEAMGTKQLGGTVRISVGPFNTHDQISKVAQAIAQCAGSASEVLNT